MGRILTKIVPIYLVIWFIIHTFDASVCTSRNVAVLFLGSLNFITRRPLGRLIMYSAVSVCLLSVCNRSK